MVHRSLQTENTYPPLKTDHRKLHPSHSQTNFKSDPRKLTVINLYFSTILITKVIVPSVFYMDYVSTINHYKAPRIHGIDNMNYCQSNKTVLLFTFFVCSSFNSVTHTFTLTLLYVLDPIRLDLLF